MIHVRWSIEDEQHVATIDTHPSLSWLADTQTEALAGLRSLLGDMEAGCV